MTRLLFIYPLLQQQQQTFRYAQTARRLFNEKVDVRLLTVGQRKDLPVELTNLPHYHIDAPPYSRAVRWRISHQRKIRHYLKSIPSEGLSIFMNSLELPVVFWACKQQNIPLIAQFPEEQAYTSLYRRFLRQIGGSPDTTLLYGSQLHADNGKLGNWQQTVVSMPLSPQLVEKAQYFRSLNTVRADYPFSIIIGCRSASTETLQHLQLLAQHCPTFNFYCWFFQEEHLQQAAPALKAHPNLKCLHTSSGIQLYQNSDLYIEVEEPGFVNTHLRHLHYIKEAMAFGLPAMLFQNGFGQEWIKPGINGYLLESRDLMEMINKIKLLEHSQLLYGRLSQNAYKMAQQWHPPNTCKALANLFLGGKMKCTYRTGLKTPVDSRAT